MVIFLVWNLRLPRVILLPCCCPQLFLKQGETVTSRCDELQSLMKRGCNESMIENPHGRKRILVDKEVTIRKPGDQLEPEDITQIQPQKVSLTLRSGEETFHFREPAEGFECSTSRLTDDFLQVSPRLSTWNSNVPKTIPSTCTTWWTCPTPWRTIWRTSRTSEPVWCWRCQRSPLTLG